MLHNLGDAGAKPTEAPARWDFAFAVGNGLESAASNLGRESVWPHDHRTGWSYCITVPSWIVLAKSRDSDPTVFYRVQVGIQSPEGITTTRTVLRRFNDFLKLHAALKRAFPLKSIPPTPPKGLLQMKTRAMLEARRSSLEEWMAKLLSDIEVSRSMFVASFLELEAAARSSFQEEVRHNADSHLSVTTTDSSTHFHPNTSMSMTVGSSSVASDYGSDSAYEISDIGSPSRGRDNSSTVETEDMSHYDDVTSPVDKFVKYGMSNIDEGLSMGNAILEKLENFPKHKPHIRENHNSERKMSNGSSSRASHHADDMSEHLADHNTLVHHGRKLSSESIGSDRSSLRGSEPSSFQFPNSNGHGHGLFDFGGGAEDAQKTGTVGELDFQLPDDIHVLVPMDQRQKMSRVLMSMQRRLITAKTDMEDLISRLNQEVAVKDYLMTKVKDLEVELETSKQKSKENLEQAILIERERVTQMQWDMEELRQRSMELELKLNSQQDQRPDAQPSISPANQQTDNLCQELDNAKQQFEDLLKRHQELEVKSKADIRVLVKEVKSLRSSQVELTQQFNQSLIEKSKMEELLQEEKERNERARNSWGQLLHKCKILQDQLQECNIDNLKNTEGDAVDSLPSLLDQLDFVGTSGTHIDLLIAEVQQLAEDGDDHTSSIDEELRRILTSILVDNGLLRKQVNSLIVNSLKRSGSNEKGETECKSELDVENELTASIAADD